MKMYNSTAIEIAVIITYEYVLNWLWNVSDKYSKAK